MQLLRDVLGLQDFRGGVVVRLLLLQQQHTSPRSAAAGCVQSCSWPEAELAQQVYKRIGRPTKVFLVLSMGRAKAMDCKLNLEDQLKKATKPG